MEDTLTCNICLDRKRNVAFLCGHSACNDCAQPLRQCHMCRKPITKRINLFNWHVTANVIGVVNLSLTASIYSTVMSHSYNCHNNCHTLVSQHWNTAVATVTQLSQLPHLTCLIMINNFVLDVRKYCQDFMCMTHWLFFSLISLICKIGESGKWTMQHLLWFGDCKQDMLLWSTWQ